MEDFKDFITGKNEPTDEAEILTNLKDLIKGKNVLEKTIDSLSELNFTKKNIIKYKTSSGDSKYITLTSNSVDKVIDKLISGYENSIIPTFGSDVIDEFDINMISEIDFLSIENKTRNDGSFFPYYNNTEFDLTKYQIYTKEDFKKISNLEHCMIHTLKMSKLFSEDDIYSISSLLTGSFLPKVKIRSIAEKLNCTIKLRYNYKNEARTKIITYNKGYYRVLNIGLLRGHYFLDEVIPYHPYAVKNRDCESFKKNKRKYEIYKSNGKNLEYSKNYSTKSYFIINEIFKTNGFKALPFDVFHNSIDYQRLEKQYKEFRILDNDLEYECEITSEKPPWNDKIKNICFADFECTTDGGRHRSFMISYNILVNIDEPYDKNNTKNFTGFKCPKTFLNALPDKVLVYFHNMKYDWQQLEPFVTVVNIVEKEGILYQVECRAFNKKIYFRDSLKMIPQKLADFSDMFDLNIKKEIMPYDAYTEPSVQKPFININEAQKCIKKEADFREFIENLKTLECIIGHRFRHIKYAKFYCNQDVNVLAEGFLTFRKWCLESIGLDPLDYLTISSMSHAYFIKKGCFKGITKLTGTVRQFVHNSIVGGRVMTKNNKKWYLKERIQDFDGVSLYPSAMSRITGYPKGLAKRITCLEYEDLQTKDFYVVEVKITDLKYKFDCPMFSYKSEDGKCIWENKVPEVHVFLDKITLEDCIKHHGISFDIIQGIYWNEGVNDTICKEIVNVFNLRAKYKEEGNKIEQVFKLLMNSAYGKTIEKEMDSKTVIIYGTDNMTKYFIKNCNMIKTFVEINSDIIKEESRKCYKVKLYKSTLEQTNIGHCGSLILGMSKRIMNELTVVAKKVKCPIYYCDTDSTHIPEKKINELEKAFKETYKRDLIGKGLGQFHCDFKLNSCKNIVAIESVFISPKIYCDKLIGINKITEEEEKGYHYRCKGVSSKSIQYKGDTDYGGDIIEMYSCKKKVLFDLLCDSQIKFEYLTTGGIRSKKEFTREINF